MSVFKGTPGPWHSDTGGDVTRDDGTTLLTREHPIDCALGESFANAALAAAAPELLAFAETFIARVEEDGEPTPGTRWHAEYVAAKALVAKATGESA